MEKIEKVFAAFYCGKAYGSEYASGHEFSIIARNQGFEIVTSNIELNDVSFSDRVIDSLIVKQKYLYKFDAFAEIFWQRSLAKSIKQKKEIIWLQNVAVPWLPPFALVGKANILKWGPVGGGEPIKYKKKIFNSKKIFKEFIRNLSSLILAKLFLFFCKFKHQKIEITYRTKYAKNFFIAIGFPDGEIISERDFQSKKFTSIKKGVRENLLFVGQNVDRKNFDSALEMFQKFKLIDVFKTLTVYGSGFEKYEAVDGVKVLGYQKKIPWEKYSSNSVLFIYSLREGLPSIFIEAREKGLVVLSSPVGFMADLSQIEGVYVMPEKAINFSKKNYEYILKLRANGKL